KYEKYIIHHHPYTLRSLIETHLALFSINPDLFHATNLSVPVFWPGKIVITVHDLIKHYSRGLANTTHHPVTYWLKYLEYLILITLAIRRASFTIVPAKYWKVILMQKYHLHSNKISVTYESPGVEFQKGHSFKDSPYRSIPKPFMVYTGNLYPHKNVGVLIKAADKLKIDVVIVCARSVFEKRLPLSPRVHYLGRLTDPELVQLYHEATAFVFPSLIEGFGLPGLEAMAVGLPVIAARASCLPEIYGDAALYFDPCSVDDLTTKTRLLLSDEKLRSTLIFKGKFQVKKYSWRKMSLQTWKIYQNVLSS
ncbi:glycosyltransferase family 4 protein, partial [Candidatus Amesbacteria bacterium]|nr:glycosyltransferase family 4 protein [Candidatus Amesbacteria bacterium]